MAAYDPKRPRPSSTSDPDEPPPVDALLEPAPDTPAPEAAADAPPAEDAGPGADAPEPDARDPEQVDEVDLRTAASTSGNGSRPAPKRVTEVPIAPAPEEGTANRAVLIAALVSTTAVAVLVALLLRRRRHRDA